MQRAIGALVEELGLSNFTQRSDGDVVFERMSQEPAQRNPGLRQEPQSMHLVGRPAALLHVIAQDLPESALYMSAPVTRLSQHENLMTVMITRRDDGEEIATAEQVVAAVPPRVMPATISFTPTLPPATQAPWQRTATWMAQHATGYWEMAQSMIGPMPEIHDATTATGQAALIRISRFRD